MPKVRHSAWATAAGELLAKLGLTPQKPLQRAYQREPEAIERWRREILPRKAREGGGAVYFWSKTWSVKERPGQRQSISAASAVNSKGWFWVLHLPVALLKKIKSTRLQWWNDVASRNGLRTLHYLPVVRRNSTLTNSCGAT